MMNHEDARGQQEAWVALWKVECQAKVNKCWRVCRILKNLGSKKITNGSTQVGNLQETKGPVRSFG